jgi:uncharacterized protein YlxP (DUF503 family)
MAFICLLELDLHLPEAGDLKGKRKHVTSLKTQLQQRFGAAVAETDHQDLRQRATLSVALVAPGRVQCEQRADAVDRFARERFGDWVRSDRTIRSTTDIRDH